MKVVYKNFVVKYLSRISSILTATYKMYYIRVKGNHKDGLIIKIIY